MNLMDKMPVSAMKDESAGICGGFGDREVLGQVGVGKKRQLFFSCCCYFVGFNFFLISLWVFGLYVCPPYV